MRNGMPVSALCKMCLYNLYSGRSSPPLAECLRVEAKCGGSSDLRIGYDAPHLVYFFYVYRDVFIYFTYKKASDYRYLCFVQSCFIILVCTTFYFCFVE